MTRRKGLGDIWYRRADDTLLDTFERQHRSINIQYVQAASIQTRKPSWNVMSRSASLRLRNSGTSRADARHPCSTC
jgi:hypothetical protein